MQTIPRKDQIRQKAQTLFRERGYAATSMRDLAETMGIEAASLYNHIASKEEILQQICFSMADAFFAAHESAVAVLDDSASSATERLRLSIEAHLRVIASNGDAAAVFFHEWRHMGEPFLGDFRMMRRRYEGLFRAIVEEGTASGQFRSLDPALAAKTILSATNWTYESYRSAKLSPEAVSAEITSIVLHGITKS